jgi:putative transposase
MPVRPQVLSIDEYYHIYNRGVDKRAIFLEEEDYRRFIKLLYLCNGSIPVEYRNFKSKSFSEIDTGDKLVAIGAYCLMPNHFHILIREIHENGIVKFMSKLLTAYSSYFNKKYDRSGALFGSEFKSEHLDGDEYLKYIFSYIHLNPAKLKDPFWRESTENRKELFDFVNTYPYSSHLFYFGQYTNQESLILNKEYFPLYFSGNDYEREIWEWLNYNEIPLPRPGLGKSGDNSM